MTNTRIANANTAPVISNLISSIIRYFYTVYGPQIMGHETLIHNKFQTIMNPVQTI